MRFWTSRSSFLLSSLVLLPLVATRAAAADIVAVASPSTAPQALVAPKPVAAVNAARTRFVVGLDRKVEFQVFSLANPNRVVIELPDVELRMPDPLMAASK